MRDVTSGKLEGDKIGSTSVSLHPGSIGSGIFLADTHTAGWDMLEWLHDKSSAIWSFVRRMRKIVIKF